MTTDDTAPPEARGLTLVRMLDAPRALVFRVWTQPEHLVRWWGPHGFTLPSCRMELRPGGFYHFWMRGPEGDDHWLEGEYREVVEPERLSFTWAWRAGDGTLGPETLVTVTLEAVGERTKLTLHQAVFESETARDLHEDGWTGCLERLVAYVRDEAA